MESYIYGALIYIGIQLYFVQKELQRIADKYAPEEDDLDEDV